MGEFLSKPIKDKAVEEGENPQVFFIHISLNTLYARCKDGEREWKTLI